MGQPSSGKGIALLVHELLLGENPALLDYIVQPQGWTGGSSL